MDFTPARLSPPPEHQWHVEKTGFDPKTGKLDLHLNFEAGGVFECGGCGGKGRKAYDTAWKRWRHLNLFQHARRSCMRRPRR